VKIDATLEEECADPHIGFGIRTRMGIVVYEANTYTLGYRTRPLKRGDTLGVQFSFNCALYPGTYELMVGVADGGFGQGSFERAFFFDQAFLIFEVLPGEKNGWQGIYDFRPEVFIH
jgi:lipopolysaccharide transport system ATP-binding protein